MWRVEGRSVRGGLCVVAAGLIATAVLGRHLGARSVDIRPAVQDAPRGLPVALPGEGGPPGLTELQAASHARLSELQRDLERPGSVRSAILKEAAGLPLEEAFELLEGQIDSLSREEQMDMLDGLRTSPVPHATPFLADRIRRVGNGDEELLSAFLTALGLRETANPELTTTLIELVSLTNSLRARAAVLSVLPHREGTDASFEYLERVVRSPSEPASLRSAAVFALGGAHGDRAGSVLRSAREQEEDVTVRSAIDHVLAMYIGRNSEPTCGCLPGGHR